METEEVRVEGHITIGEVTLFPIVQLRMSCRNSNGGILCYASKKPIGIVVISHGSRQAVNADGEEVPIEQYLEQVPQVRDLLQHM